MPFKGIKRTNRTGTLLRRHQKAIKAGSVVHFASAVYRRILMGHGRNAIDVAFSWSFGTDVMIAFKIVTREVTKAQAERYKAYACWPA